MANSPNTQEQTATATGEAATGEPHVLEPWTDSPSPPADADSSLGDDALTSTASINSSILRYRTLNGRTYHSDRGGQHYWGPNDERQNNTVDVMNHVWTLLLGKLYLAPLPDHIDKAIDLGTGTGIWAIDFADERPDTEVIGTDLSPIQPLWVPPNLSFQIDDFSEQWTFADNSVDYIHARWLCGGVTDWTELFKSAYRALKPGGWLESCDCNGMFESDDGSLTEKMALHQWVQIFQEGGRKLGLNVSYTPILENLQRKAFDEAGFVNIVEKPLKIPSSDWPKDPVLKDAGSFFRAALWNDIEGTVSYMATHIGWTKEHIATYSAHLRQELKNPRIHAYGAARVVYGQKPLDD